MTLLKYNPSLRNVEDKSFSTMLDRFFNDSFSNFATTVDTFSPKVDISETKVDFQLELAVPGMKKGDFNIDMKKDQLTISGERKREEKKDDKNYHSVETAYGSFSRSFFLPENIKADEIEASYDNGILKITIPKDEKKELVKTIQIK